MPEPLPDPAPLRQLEMLDVYRRLFTDAALWQPYVSYVCRRHFSDGLFRARCGVPGTYPTFIVDERRVVKFFGRLFDGAQSFLAESETARLLQPAPDFCVPAWLAQGQLLDEDGVWPWPYLIFEFVPGEPIGAAWEAMDFAARSAVVAWLGGLLRRIHAVPPGDSPLFQPDRTTYLHLQRARRAGCRERHAAWGLLPPPLLDQLNDYLPSPEALSAAPARLHLVHADLTADHLLGRLQESRWRTAALIDFGDAQIGDLVDELPALHLDLLRCDPRLLATLLDAYGLDEAARVNLPRRAMSAVLLHPFNVLEGVQRYAPTVLQARSLDEMAERLWEGNCRGAAGI